MYSNGYTIYVDIINGEKLSSIKVANMDIIYWSVHSRSKRGGDRMKWVDGGIVILASYMFYFMIIWYKIPVIIKPFV